MSVVGTSGDKMFILWSYDIALKCFASHDDASEYAREQHIEMAVIEFVEEDEDLLYSINS